MSLIANIFAKDISQNPLKPKFEIIKADLKPPIAIICSSDASVDSNNFINSIADPWCSTSIGPMCCNRPPSPIEFFKFGKTIFDAVAIFV